MYYSLAQEKRKHSGAIMNCELALAKRKRRSNYELCIMNWQRQCRFQDRRGRSRRLRGHRGGTRGGCR